jgi:hypothetical protein
MVIQLALLVATQLHPAVAVTATVAVKPPAPMVLLVGAIEYVHPAVACVTVKVSPAMVRVPVRAIPLAFAATEYPTVPGPVPEAPEMILIQAALLVAPQGQPVVAFTLTEPVPAPAPTEALAGRKA